MQGVNIKEQFDLGRKILEDKDTISVYHGWIDKLKEDEPVDSLKEGYRKNLSDEIDDIYNKIHDICKRYPSIMNYSNQDGIPVVNNYIASLENALFVIEDFSYAVKMLSNFYGFVNLLLYTGDHHNQSLRQKIDDDVKKSLSKILVR